MNNPRRNTTVLFLCSLVALAVCGSAWAKSDNLESSFILSTYSKTVSLDFKDADIKDVVKALSLQIGVNFLVADGIQRKSVTVYLENVPVEEALDMIISAQNLTYQFDESSNTILIKPALKDEDLLETRIYQLKYASVASSKINSTLAMSSAASVASSSSGSSSAASSSMGTGIVGILQGVLSSNGKVVEDPRTNSLVVTELPKRFPVVEKTIARLDVPIPQILIEVEMLDVAQNTLDNMGLKFTTDNVLAIDGSALDYTRTGYQRYSAVTGLFKKGIVTSTLSAVLELIRTDGTTRALARPRILTLDNETAQIKISTNEVIGVRRSITGTTGDNTTDEAERLETGVIFTVTPQANLLLGEVTLAIVPKVIDSGLPSALGNYKNPEERSINALIKVKDGETVIIGGLLREQKTSKISKLPLLGDIPIVGGIFRNKNDETTTRDLLVILTPHILGMNDVPAGHYTNINGNAGFHREQGISDPRSAAIMKALDRESVSAEE